MEKSAFFELFKQMVFGSFGSEESFEVKSRFLCVSDLLFIFLLFCQHSNNNISNIIRIVVLGKNHTKNDFVSDEKD